MEKMAQLMCERETSPCGTLIRAVPAVCEDGRPVMRAGYGNGPNLTVPQFNRLDTDVQAFKNGLYVNELIVWTGQGHSLEQPPRQVIALIPRLLRPAERLNQQQFINGLPTRRR